MPGNPFAEELQKRQNPFVVEAQRRQQLPSIVPNGRTRPLPADMFRRQLVPGAPGSTVSTAGGPDTGIPQALTRGAITRLVEAIANTPELLHDTNLTNIMTVPRPELARRNIPLPTGREAVAGLETLLDAPEAMASSDVTLGNRFQENLEHANQVFEEHPISTTVGGALADAATIAAGRVPFARSAPLRFVREGARPEIFFGAAQSAVKPTTLRLLNRFVQSPVMTKLARGAGRSIEAGFEGAALSALHGGDPLETAAYAAGGQTLGSLLIGGTTLRNPKTLPIRALALFSTIQLTKSFVPGGRDRSLESIESAFDGIKYAIVLGAAARLAGAGRRGEMITDKVLPRVAETFNSMHRGTAISLIEQAVNDQTGTVESVIQKLATNPDAFNAAQRARLERAMNNGNLDSEIDKLMEVPSFREALDGENE